MFRLTGEFDCKLDEKSRLRLPSTLLRQLGDAGNNFVINRGFEKHLILYPKEVWVQRTNEINQLNINNTQHRQVIRYFYRGASELVLDSASRILLPKSLVEYAEIESDVMVFAYQQIIEIWSKLNYEQMINEEPEDFSAIAHQAFAKPNLGDGGE